MVSQYCYLLCVYGYANTCWFDCRQVVDDWQYISLIIDRLLLYIYAIVTLAGTLAILMYAPHIFTDFDQKMFKYKNAIERCCKENFAENEEDLKNCRSHPELTTCKRDL